MAEGRRCDGYSGIEVSSQDSGSVSAEIPRYQSLNTTYVSLTHDFTSILIQATDKTQTPIYFQVVKGVSATKSGALCLPSVIGLFTSVVLGGSGTSLFGYYAPFIIATSILTPITAGLLTTLSITTSLTLLIAYQALLGFGTGIGFQDPQTAASTIFSPTDAPLGIAAIIFAQNFGAALFVPVAQTIFQGRLGRYLEEYVPGLDGGALANMGLLDLKQYVGSEELGRALLGYDKAVTRTLFLPIALTYASLLGALGMEWGSVNVKKS